MNAFTPTIDDMEAEYDGVLVASIGEHGESAIAVTSDTTAAYQALTRYYRDICDQPLLDDPDATEADAYKCLEVRQVSFHHTVIDDCPTWKITPAAPSAPHALHVTFLNRTGHDPTPPYNLPEDDWR